MMRRRPIARMAVRTTAVVGTEAAPVRAAWPTSRPRPIRPQAAQAPTRGTTIRSGPRSGRARSD